MKNSCFLLLLLFIFNSLGCSGPKKAQITAYDHICLPGEKIELSAKLESSGFLRGDIKNEKILFYQNGVLIGEEITQKEGRVSVPYIASEEGFIQIEARLESDNFASPPSQLLLRVAKPETKFLVVDIDNTISDLSPILMLITENAKIPPMKGAPKALQQLSKEYTIIYMTGRDDTMSPKTKAWLHENGFPEGPVFFWDFLRTPLSKQKYKNELISKIGRKFQLVQIGIGNSVGDAFAYLANGLETFILLSKDKKKRAKKLPRGARIVSSWDEIQQLLF